MDLWQFTPLHEAASKNRVEVCSLLLSHCADPTLVNCHTKTAIDVAPSRELQQRLQCKLKAMKYLIFSIMLVFAHLYLYDCIRKKMMAYWTLTNDLCGLYAFRGNCFYMTGIYILYINNNFSKIYHSIVLYFKALANHLLNKPSVLYLLLPNVACVACCFLSSVKI